MMIRPKGLRIPQYGAPLESSDIVVGSGKIVVVEGNSKLKPKEHHLHFKVNLLFERVFVGVGVKMGRSDAVGVGVNVSVREGVGVFVG